MTRDRSNQRGVALVVVAIFLTVIFGFTALGVDVARLAFIATEVQSVADAAARGGAKELLDRGGTPNAGITRAHAIARKNDMNGALARNADVLVDEGHFHTDTRQFECCTNNSPCCSGHQNMGDWQCVAATASCDARSAVLAMPHTTVDNLFAWVFDYINNGVIGSVQAAGAPNATTTVEKVAVATSTGPPNACRVPDGCDVGDWGCYCDHGAPPCLPITARACEFPPNCNGDGCTLPNLTVGPDGTDTAGWWQSGSNQPSNSNVVGALEQGPCSPPGSPDPIDTSEIGTSIQINNGLNSSSKVGAFGLVRCLAAVSADPETTQLNSVSPYDPPFIPKTDPDGPQGCALDPTTGQIIPGQRGAIFTIPIVDGQCSDQFNQASNIVGYATIEITSVVGVNGGIDPNPHDVSQPTASPLISIITRANKTSTGTGGGGGCFGTDCQISMTQ